MRYVFMHTFSYVLKWYICLNYGKSRYIRQSTRAWDITDMWHKNKTAELNLKLTTTINLDRCAYIFVVLHQSFIKTFKGIRGMF